MKRISLLKATSGAALTLAAPHLALSKTRPLRFVPQADLAVLDPVYAVASVTRNHAFMVFDTLYGLDDDYLLQPQAAPTAGWDRACSGGSGSAGPMAPTTRWWLQAARTRTRHARPIGGCWRWRRRPRPFARRGTRGLRAE